MRPNPYEQYPFHGKITGGKQPALRDVEALIVPDEDNPLSFPFRIVHRVFLHRRLWPVDTWRNPFFAYYMERRRRYGTEMFFLMGPWLMLLAIEVAVLLMGALQGIPLGVMMIAVLAVECLLLPPLAGIFFLGYTFGSIRRFAPKENMQELATTPVEGRHMVRGLAFRPMLTFVSGIVANAAGLMLLVTVAMIAGIEEPAWMYGIVAVLLFVRCYMTRCAASHAVACALRAGLLIRENTHAWLRALRDFFFFNMNVAGLAVVAVLIVLLAYLPFCFPLCVTLFLLPGGLLFLAASVEEMAVQVLDWLGPMRPQWVAMREGDSPLAPRGVWDPWDMSTPTRASIHPLLREGASK